MRAFRRPEIVAGAAGPWVVFVAALAVGLASYWPLTGAISGPHDVDEAVYYAAARAWLTGHAPYVDFVYTQPPLSLVWLMPGVLVDLLIGHEDAGFLTGRMLSTVCLAGTAALVWQLFSRRYKAPVAGTIAAALLLLDGTTAVVGHRILLEPFLNLLTIAVLLLALDGRLLLAALVAAVAVLTKTQGVLACMPLLVVGCARRDWMGVVQSLLLLGTVAAGTLAIGGWLSSAELIQQSILFQFVRPTESTLSDFGGLSLWLLNPFTMLLAVAGLLGLFRTGKARGIDPPATLAVVCWLLAALVLVARSYSYYYHYWSQMALPLAIVAGFLMLGPSSAAVCRVRVACAGVLSLLLLRQPAQLAPSLTQDHEVELIRSQAAAMEGAGFDPTGFANIVLSKPSPVAGGKLAIDAFATEQYLDLRPFRIARVWAPYDWDSMASTLIDGSGWVWTDPKGERLLLPDQKVLRDALFGKSAQWGNYRFYGDPLVALKA